MIGIVNYEAGNIFSITAALKRLNIAYGMVNTPEELEQYEKIIIPGVGHAGAAMAKLEARGMVEPIRQLTKPVLGICVGMQLLTDFSEEGNSDLVGIIPLKTLHFEERIQQKVPHMGWNSIEFENTCPLFQDIPNNSYFYFVHSFYAQPQDPQHAVGETDYGGRFASAIARDRWFATQFHPEKSADHGLALFRNFLHWNP